MIVFRTCALGDAVLTVPLLRALGRETAPLVVAHGEHLALWRDGGVGLVGLDAQAHGLHRLWAQDAGTGAELTGALPAKLAVRLAAGESVVLISAPGPLCDRMVHNLRTAGGGAVVRCDPQPPPGMHAADHLFRAAADLGSVTGSQRAPDPRLVFPAERGARVAIHVGAGAARKRWPAARWAALAQVLPERLRVEVVCGPADEEATAEFLELRHAPVLRPASASELAAALASCDALLGHDSGVCHLAAAVGTPTFALFGPTDPAAWAPRGPHARALCAGPSPTPLPDLPLERVQRELRGWLDDRLLADDYPSGSRR